MDRLSALFEGLLEFVQPLAERLGGPGLALIAFLDSSFLSLPEVGDALIVLLVIREPARWMYYATATTIGSVAGCYALYSVGRHGGEAFLKRRFKARHIERGLDLFRRHGMLAVIVPSILPPPMPFKIFVLLSGVAKVKPLTFILAVALGRGFRYGGEAWLAYMYGARAAGYIRDNLPTVSLWVGLTVLVGGVGFVWWRRRKAAA